MIWNREARNNARALNALQDDYRRTFSTPEGQRVLTDLAMKLRKRYGEDILTRRLCKGIKGNQSVAISGIRFRDPTAFSTTSPTNQISSTNR